MADDAPASTTVKTNPNMELTRVVCFCKDCGKVIEGRKITNRFAYKCELCGTKNVAFGTERSIRSFYHVKEA